ncbi:FecR family protein [Pedobacter heparinus]|uniref:FecR family protein n=1 Tax=Pedobacter heparinus TaxID=984 RepID=UPI0029318C07|nr:FecR domain-containing protein [Pedobacter heparinus]
MENLEKLKTSFYKYLNNELGEADARQFLEHLQSGTDSAAFLLLIENSLDSPLADQLLNKPELLGILNQSFARISDTIDAKPKRSPMRLWPRMAAGIAAVLALTALGIYFFNAKNAEPNNGFTMSQDVAPGKTGATLTLANGKKIRLADAAKGEIAREAGIRVSKTAEGQLVYEIGEGSGDPGKLNKLSTAKGETYMVTLPDKSRVWMNAASSLTYATSLHEPQRRVKLEGEAYFEVAEDKAHPFIVETEGQKIEVLGTHFNVNAYTDEETVTTTLLQGSVKVSGKPGSKMLKPGDQSSLDQRSISVARVDTERAIAWKNNKFLFENDDIQYIMRMIARWYDVDVVYTGEMPTEKFGGGVSRFDHASQVLKILESTGGAHFKIEGRKILVSK